MTQKDQERLEILKNILIKLHQGADPKSVQKDFNQHFTGVSAIEISMMEHQLMNSDTGITFEDVMQLCTSMPISSKEPSMNNRLQMLTYLAIRYVSLRMKTLPSKQR